MRIGNYLASATTLVIVGVTTLLVGVLITEEHHRALDAKRSAASMFTELFASSLSALVVFDDRDEVHKDLDNLRKTEGVVAAAIWLPNAPAPVASFGPNLEQSVSPLPSNLQLKGPSLEASRRGPLRLNLRQ